MTVEPFYNKSENLYKDALEVLQEILYYDSSLHVWFDRDTILAVGDGLSADIVSLPPLATSRSNERLNEDNRITGRKDVKLNVAERAVFRIDRDAA